MKSLRTRRRPGPLFLIALAWLALAGARLRAHDPGLSALDITVTDAGISASLAIAAPDVALLVPVGDPKLMLGQLARDAIHLSIDGAPLSAVVGDVAIDEGAALVQLSFATRLVSGEAWRLTIASDLSKRATRGHRELVVVKRDDRVLAQKLLDAESASAEIAVASVTPSATAAGHFLELGVHHILSGVDHLVFLAGLLLAVRTLRELTLALTAFTAAHSVSLALVVIAGLRLPSSIVEPAIAATIAWVGLENLRHGPHGARWLPVFGFGLIHGFGFADALINLGLGSSLAQTALALLSFNGGVEVGQLAVSAVMLPIVWTIRSRPVWHARLMPVCFAMIGLIGTYWLVERIYGQT